MPPLDTISEHNVDDRSSVDRQTLRLMSYNVQTGINTTRFFEYMTSGWKHVFPISERASNLDRVAELAKQYDMVGLQEVDAGSFRSGFINQTEYLAKKSGFPFWYYQVNRRLGQMAQHSNGILCRMRPFEVRDYRLPGVIPGRRALLMRFAGSGESLNVLIVHLALSQRARLQQLEFVAELVNEFEHAIVMGDMNCLSQGPEMDLLLKSTSLREPAHDLHTYPSWRPQRNIDHILVSNSLDVQSVKVIDFAQSDHLPIAMEVVLPKGLNLYD